MLTASTQSWLLSARGGDVREFFAQIGVSLPDRSGVEEITVSCFANPEAHNRGDRTPSCSVSLITGLWHCKACGASGNAYHAALAVGRSERHAADLARRHGLFLEPEKKAERPKLPGERQLRQWRERLHASAAIIRRLGELRGWTPQGLARCGVGWDGERLTFAVRARNLKLVGLVRYLPGGTPKTLALPGSKRSLFPAPEVTSRQRPVFVVEGEPDAIAVWSCGHQAIAVPGAGSWRTEWLQRFGNRQLIVLPDCDPQGRNLASQIVSAGPNARMVDLDPARDDGYDIGDLIRETSHEGGIWQAHRLLGALAA